MTGRQDSVCTRCGRRDRPSRCTPRTGFTLVEAVTVLAVSVGLIGAGIPILTGLVLVQRHARTAGQVLTAVDRLALELRSDLHAAIPAAGLAESGQPAGGLGGAAVRVDGTTLVIQRPDAVVHYELAASRIVRRVEGDAGAGQQTFTLAPYRASRWEVAVDGQIATVTARIDRPDAGGRAARPQAAFPAIELRVEAWMGRDHRLGAYLLPAAAEGEATTGEEAGG